MAYTHTHSDEVVVVEEEEVDVVEEEEVDVVSFCHDDAADSSGTHLTRVLLNT